MTRWPTKIGLRTACGGLGIREARCNSSADPLESPHEEKKNRQRRTGEGMFEGMSDPGAGGNGMMTPARMRDGRVP